MNAVPGRMRILLSLSVLLGLSVLGTGCNRSSGYELCTPGDTILIGCTANVGARCTGDPTLAVCEDSVAPESCESSTPTPPRLGYVDDVDGLCPELRVVCPASGRVSVNPEPFGGRSYTCGWDSRSVTP